MAKGGYRPNAGRKPGSVNTTSKTTAADIYAGAVPSNGDIGRAERVLEDSAPLGTKRFENAKEFFRAVYNNPEIDMKTRMNAAATVLPYECGKVSEVAPGKKEQKREAAANASGAWGDDLTPGRLTVVK